MFLVRSFGALVTVLAFVLAAPVVHIKRAGLPTPVSAATARTYLAAREIQGIIDHVLAGLLIMLFA